jgi:hypothetical protein
MKNASVIVALIIGVSLIIASAILASAIKDYGRSFEAASRHQPGSINIPSSFVVRMESGNSPLRFDVTSKP